VKNTKDIFPLLEQFKGYIKLMEDQRKKQISAYEKFGDFLSKYEAKMLETFNTHAEGKPLFSDDGPGPDKKDLKTELQGLQTKISNPFIRFKYWIKEETLDLHSMLEAISARAALENRKSKLDSKKKGATSDLDKIQSGKKTMKTLFKSDAGKADVITQLNATIVQCDKDRENYEKLIKLVTIHLHVNAIPQFKRRKI
jgi:hypothetical protein